MAIPRYFGILKTIKKLCMKFQTQKWLPQLNRGTTTVHAFSPI